MQTQGVVDIKIIDLGRMRYGEALLRQTQAHGAVVEGTSPSIIFVVEHDPVLTMGKNSDAGHLLFPREFYEAQGVEIFDTERGGQVTAHMPGQLVVYPILNMPHLKLSVREYVGMLEDSVISTLARYGVEAHRDAVHPGVWIGHEKICALGVRVKSHVSMHGLALNVNNDLSLFGKIVPCGIKFRGVTNLMNCAKVCPSMDTVREDLVHEITSRLGR
jgi:lipoyl(octanoyl) transferase